MKLPRPIILVFILFTTITISGQEINVQKTGEQDLSLILNRLKEEKLVSFLYEPTTVEDILISTPFTFQQDLKVILKKILPPVQLTFKKIGRNNYIIKKSKKKKKHAAIRPAMIKRPPVSQPKIEITTRLLSGTITDELGIPLIGASIYLPAYQTGTTTDMSGRFECALPVGKQAIIISYTGYDEVRLEIEEEPEIHIRLNGAENLLEEVVISALGFTQRKDELGVSASTIRQEAIEHTGEVSLLNALGAKVSNVQITRSNGDPGAGTKVQIRGANTITGVSSPLVILDGIPISNSTIYGGGNDLTGDQTGGVSQQSRLNDLNPANIATVQVLKGAAAAALWGSRAANGVLVITTKSGQVGKASIAYQTTFSFDEVMERLALQNTWGQGRNGQFNPIVAESWGDYIPDRKGGADIVDQSGAYFEATDGTSYYPILHKEDKQTFLEENWNQAIQKGGFKQHNLSISGGNEKATFFFNLGRLDQHGIIKSSDYDRTNLRLNNKFYLLDWLSIASKASYSNVSSNRIQQSSSTTGLLLGLLRTPPDFNNQHYIGTYNDGQDGVFTGRHRSYRRYLGDDINPVYNNPGWTLFEQTARSTVNRFIYSTDINIRPTDWLQFTLRGGLDNVQDKRIYQFPIGTAGSRNPGVLAEDIIGEQELNFDAVGKANFKLTKDFSLNTTLGWNINDRQRTTYSSEVTGFLAHSTKETTDLNTSNSNTSINNLKKHIRSNRGYAIIAANVQDELFITASGGLEAASSITGTFFYPSIDAAWQFTKTKLSLSWLPFGKVRASWGKVGIQPAPHRFETLAESPFSYSTYSDALAINLFGGGFRIDDDRGNPNLKPEIKTEWEFGMDLRFFQEDLSLSFTYYQNTIKDLLFDVKVSPSSGFDTQYANAGRMENNGFEAEMEYTILRKSAFTLGMFSNFSRNRNRVLQLKGTQSIDLTSQAVSSRAVVGYPLGVLFGTGSQMDQQGRYILDENGFPQLTRRQIVLGDPNPDWKGGLGIRANWKKLGLKVLIEHSQGGDFSPRTQWVLRRFGTTQETANRLTLEQDLVNYAGQVIPAGTVVRGNITDFGGGPVLLDETWYRTGIGGGFGFNQAYNFSIKDATFTRLREVSLSYTIDGTAFTKKTKLANIQISAIGRNLLLWDHLEGIDPETNQVGVSNGFGLEYFTNPSTRSYLFSVKVTY